MRFAAPRLRSTANLLDPSLGHLPISLRARPNNSAMTSAAKKWKTLFQVNQTNKKINRDTHYAIRITIFSLTYDFTLLPPPRAARRSLNRVRALSSLFHI